MRWILTIVMMALPAFASAQEAPPLKTDKDKLSYAMGMDLGAQLKSRSVDIDAAVFARGPRDALSGSKTALTANEAKAVIAELQKSLAVKQAAAAKCRGREEQDGRRGVPGGQQGEAGRGHAAERPPVQDRDGRHRQETDGGRTQSSATTEAR